MHMENSVDLGTTIARDDKRLEGQDLILIHANYSPPLPTSNHTQAPTQQPTGIESGEWWLEMSERLCPRMSPQYNLAGKMFQLARQELQSMIPEHHPNISLTMNTNRCGPLSQDSFAQRFYDHFTWFGGLTQKSEVNENEIFSIAKIWKCANNQIDSFWREVIEHVPANATKAEIQIVKRKRPPFQSRLTPYRKSGVKECVVAVVRDPVSHFLSGYNEIEYRIKIFSPRQHAAMRWPFGRHTPGTQQRFQQFLIDVLSCPVENRFPGIVGTPDLEVQHLYSMSGVLKLLATEARTMNVTRKFTYLPSLNNLTQNLGPFLVQSCPDSFSEETKHALVTADMNTKAGAHQSSADPVGSYLASKSVWSDGGVFSRALCAMHVMDYACWKDLPDGVPDLCLEVFRSYHEKGLL